MLREPPPDRLEGQAALRPRAEQEGLIGVILAGGKPDGEAADEPEPHLEGRVQPDSHDLGPYGRAGGDRMTKSSRLPGCDRVPQVPSPSRLVASVAGRLAKQSGQTTVAKRCSGGMRRHYCCYC